MLLAFSSALLLAAASCFQIPLYIPFRRWGASVCFVYLSVGFMAVAAFSPGASAGAAAPPFLLSVCMGLFCAGGCILGLRLCETHFFCGVYNIAIQLAVNLFALYWGRALYVADCYPLFSCTLGALLPLGIIEGVWCLCMYFLRRSAWVIMPQPDRYYKWPMAFTLGDLLFIMICWIFPRQDPLLVSICFLSVLVLTLYSIYLPQLIIREQQQTQMIRVQQKAQQDYILTYLRYEHELRTMHHDIRHLLTTIEALLEKNEQAQAQKLTNSFRRSFYQRAPMQFCDNLLINAILHNHQEHLQTLGVPFKVQIRLPDPVQIEDLDLTIILQNILSNALEYCQSIKKQERDGLSVCFTLYTAQQHLCIQCTNPLRTPLQVQDTRILSSRSAEPGGHGIGLESVRSTVKKYRGTVDISTDGGQFRIMVALANKNLT